MEVHPDYSSMLPDFSLDASPSGSHPHYHHHGGPGGHDGHSHGGGSGAHQEPMLGLTPGPQTTGTPHSDDGGRGAVNSAGAGALGHQGMSYDSSSGQGTYAPMQRGGSNGEGRDLGEGPSTGFPSAPRGGGPGGIVSSDLYNTALVHHGSGEHLDPMALDALLASIVASPSDDHANAPPPGGPSSSSHQPSTGPQNPTSRHSRAASVSSTRSMHKRPLDGDAGVSSPVMAAQWSQSSAGGVTHANAPPNQGPGSRDALQQVLSSLGPETQQSLLAALLSSQLPAIQNAMMHKPNPSPGPHPTQQHPPHTQAPQQPQRGHTHPQFQRAFAAASSGAGGLAPVQQSPFLQPQKDNGPTMPPSAMTRGAGESQPTSPAGAFGDYGPMRDSTSSLGHASTMLSPSMTPHSVFSVASSTSPSWAGTATGTFSTDLSTATTPSFAPGGYGSARAPHHPGAAGQASGSSRGPSQQGVCAPSDFFSPLTSPALRPQGHEDGRQSIPMAMDPSGGHQPMMTGADMSALQPLIDQAAALGLSSPFPFQILSHPPTTAVPPASVPGGPDMQQVQMMHHFALAEAQKAYARAAQQQQLQQQGPMIAGPNPTFANANQSGQSPASTNGKASRSRVSRGTGKTRPSPLIRPSDAGRRSGPRTSGVPGIEADEGTGPKDPKRARSVVSGSSSRSAEASPIVATVGGGGSSSARHTPLMTAATGHPYSGSAGPAGSAKDTPSPVDLGNHVISSNPTIPMAVDAVSTMFTGSAGMSTSSSATAMGVGMMPPPSMPFRSASMAGISPVTPVTPASIMNLGATVGGWPGLSPHLHGVDPAGTGHAAPHDVMGPMPSVSLPPAQEQPTVDPRNRYAGVKLNSATMEALARMAAKPHYLDGRGKDFVSTAAKAKAAAEAAAASGNLPDVEEPPEARRSSHKIAEQKRRDALRNCLEDMRRILPPIHTSEEEEAERRPGEGHIGGQRGTTFDPENPNKGISKVALLRRSNEYMLTLHERIKRRDGAIELLADAMTKVRSLVDTDVATSIGVEFGIVEGILQGLEQERIEDAEARRKAAEQFDGDSDDEGAPAVANGKANKSKKKKGAAATPATKAAGTVGGKVNGSATETAARTSARGRKRGQGDDDG